MGFLWLSINDVNVLQNQALLKIFSIWTDTNILEILEVEAFCMGMMLFS